MSASLTFDADGDLVGFFSNDRQQAAGRSIPWSTPISDYRVVDGIRIGTHGERNGVDPAGEWTYGTFDVRSVAYNVDR